MNRPLALVLAALALAACGGGGGAVTGPDGGDGGHPDGGAPALATGWNAFDVTATLALRPVANMGDWRDFPKTHAFTLIVDPEAGRMIVGAGGPVSVGSVDTIDGTMFRTAEPLSVSVPFADSCGGFASVSYDEIVLTYDGALHGTARGHVSYQTGDEVWAADATATLEGGKDVTPPSFASKQGSLDPLGPLTIAVSEPLPSTATLSLRASTSGAVIALEAQRDPDDPASGLFAKPDVVLDYDEVYTVVASELADFAGLHGAADQTLAFHTGAAPPLVPEDGFESVTGPSFAGAGVLHGGPLTPIAGDTSLILNTGFGGGFGFLPYHLGPSMAVRLAVAPGDTVVRFTTQLVTVYDIPQATFYGELRVGAPGGPISRVTNVDAKDFAKVTLPIDGDVYLSPLSTLDIPLPAGVKDEVVLEISGVTFGCGLPPPPTALIIDDLRVDSL